MSSHPSTPPAFGQADLSNCEQEQIHLAGSIQPHGTLLAVSEPDHVVVQASANAEAFLGLETPVLGKALDKIDENLPKQIEPYLNEQLHLIPVAVQCRLGRDEAKFDGLIHRPVDGGLVIELEPAGPRVDLSKHLEGAFRKVRDATTLRGLCDETARLFKDLIGYDRVMVYRFDNDGHGEVFSERREEHLEAFLGNRYPATDIPQIARRLYERNRVRVLVDVEDQSIAITPRRSPITGEELDMSLCFLRTMSPIHIQYLKNMGVRATLVASLMVGGKLWGLIACHHYSARFVHYEMRAVCELLAETVATRIAALESFLQAQAEITVRRLEQRMLQAISKEADWREALFDDNRSLLQSLNATGAALLFEGEILSTGEVPGTRELRELGEWLDSQPRGAVMATGSLSSEMPGFAALKAVASGLLATPISRSSGEYLIWFRPERVRTITWGGNPFKPVIVGSEPSDLSPRRSFSQWRQVVEGTCDPWTPADLNGARLIGEALADVALQFRSVRMVIAQDQLGQVRQQVHLSDQPVIIAGPDGRITLVNEAFERLLRAVHPSLQRLDDLARLFAEPGKVRQDLKDLLQNHLTIRTEVFLETDSGDTRPLQVRADPVCSTPENVLGFVLLFTDLTERKAADIARRRFQEGILELHRVMPVQLDSKTDLLYRNLLASVVGNAQLSALEITDSLDLAHVPEKLQSVQNSVTRAAELLEHLVWHATRSTTDPS